MALKICDGAFTFPLPADIVLLIRAGKTMTKKRWEELKKNVQVMDAMKAIIKKITDAVKALFAMMKKLIADIPVTIASIMAAAMGTAAPSVPGMIKSFLTYVLKVTCEIATNTNILNDLIENSLRISGGIGGLGSYRDQLPDWARTDSAAQVDQSDFDAASGEFNSNQANADAAGASTVELNSVTEAEQLENDSAAIEIIDWKVLNQNPRITIIDTTPPNTASIILECVNLPATSTTAAWAAAGVTDTAVIAAITDPKKTWKVQVRMFGISGTDYSNQFGATDITCNFKPKKKLLPIDPSYLDEKKGEWHIGFKIPTSKSTSVNFGNEASLMAEIYLYPGMKLTSEEDNTWDPVSIVANKPDSLRAIKVKKTYEFQIK
jgi:hypothetical protein